MDVVVHKNDLFANLSWFAFIRELHPHSTVESTGDRVVGKHFEVLSNSKNKSMNITSNAIVYICSTGRPRDTSLTHLGRVVWKYWFSSFFQYFCLKPPRCHSGREASSCRGRCPFQPGLAQGTWDTIAWFHFGLILVGLSGSGQLSILTSIMMGFQCRLIMKLPSEEIALRVASTDILTLTHQ